MSQNKTQIPSREEIELLPREAKVAFAARCAIRVFPSVGLEGHFNFWGEDAEESLTTMWAAALSASLGSKPISGFAAVVVASIKATKATKVTQAATEAVSYTTATADATAYAGSYAYDTAHFAATVDIARDVTILAMRDDYAWLIQNASQIVDWTFWQRPLFDGQSVEMEEVVNSEIGKAFESVRGGSELLRMWMEFFYGSPSKDACQLWLYDWLAQNQDVGNQEGVLKSKRSGENTQKTEKVAKTPRQAKKVAKKSAKAKLNPRQGKKVAEVKEATEQQVIFKNIDESSETETAGSAEEPQTVPRSKAESANEVSQEASKHDPDASINETGKSRVEEADSAIPPGSATTSAERPAEEDKLNRDGLVKGLANMLSMPEQGTPITVGLFGHWGAGKSSVMQLLQKELSSEETRGNYKAYEFLFGWFNAWEYEHTKDIRAGLAQEVVNGLLSDGSYDSEAPRLTKPVGKLEKFRIQLNFLWQTKRKETIWLLIKVLSLVGAFFAGFWKYNEKLTDTGVLGTGVIGLGCFFTFQVFKQAKELWSHPIATELATFFKLPSYRQELGQIPVIREQLEGLCKIRLSKVESEPTGNKGSESTTARKTFEDSRKPRVIEFFKPTQRARRLIIFIDDLDRCHTETISEAFDAIRLIVDLDGVIVIVGIDERIAFKAMGEAYKDYADAAHGRTKEDVARDYLGKIIQIPIRLDTPTSKGLETFIEDKLFPKEQRAKKQSPLVDSELMEGGMGPSGFAPDLFKEMKESIGGPRFPEKQDLDEQLEAAEKSGEDEKAKAELREREEAAATLEAQKQARLEEWNRMQREHMRESDDEVAAFIQLSQCFNFSNPRQLVRLRNTYRLLKALYPDQRKPDEIVSGPSEFHYPKEEYSLLMMLFWLEFQLQSNESEVKQWNESYAAPVGVESESVLDIFDISFLPQAKGGFPEKRWRLLCEFTRTCLLPYPIKEAPEVVNKLKKLDLEKSAEA